MGRLRHCPIPAEAPALTNELGLRVSFKYRCSRCSWVIGTNGDWLVWTASGAFGSVRRSAELVVVCAGNKCKAVNNPHPKTTALAFRGFQGIAITIPGDCKTIANETFRAFVGSIIGSSCARGVKRQAACSDRCGVYKR